MTLKGFKTMKKQTTSMVVINVKPGQTLSIVLDQNQVLGFVGGDTDELKSEWIVTIKATCSLVNPDDCVRPITSDLHLKGCTYYAPSPAEIYKESLLARIKPDGEKSI